MEENENTAAVTETDLAAFDETWDGEAVPEPVEDAAGQEAESAETGGGAGEPEAGAEGPAAQEAAPPESAAPNNEGAQSGQETPFVLTLDSGPVTLGRDEVVRLAQKGAGFDRVKADYDGLAQAVDDLGGVPALREYVAFLKELADNSGVTIPQVMDSTRAGMIARRDRVDMSVAMERVKLQKRERELNAREQSLNGRPARRGPDFRAFVNRYPQVKASDIPASVWKAVRKGEDLVSAYEQYRLSSAQAENSLLRSQIETMRKNKINREKSAGSQQTAGTVNTKADPFDIGWDAI